MSNILIDDVTVLSIIGILLLIILWPFFMYRRRETQFQIDKRIHSEVHGIDPEPFVISV
jgi:preprotein translocase subunit YajC